MDANQDVHTDPFVQVLQSHGFQEQISSWHGHLEPPPGTHIDNMKGIPIDGIWTNFAHGQLRCGHLAFDASFPTDHHLSWIDIPDSLEYGHPQPHVHRVYLPKLTVMDPWIWKKCNEKVMQILWENGTIDNIKRLLECVRNQSSADEACPFHKGIRASCKQVGLEVTKGICKICTGAYPYSPAVKWLIAQKTL
jgi:hypothetical protein